MVIGGWILLVTGALAIIISLVVNQQRTRSATIVEERRTSLPRDDRRAHTPTGGRRMS